MSVLTAVANLANGNPIPESYVDAVTVDVNYLVIAGAALASAGTITPTAEFHKVTGTANIDNLTPASPIAGQQCRLWFTGAAVVRNNGAGSGNIRTTNGGDITLVANQILTFTYDGTVWREAGSRLVVNGDVSATAAIAATKIASALGLASASADLVYLKGSGGTRIDFGSIGAGVTTAVAAFVKDGSGIEFGHSNAAYRGTLGADKANGLNFLALHGEYGTSSSAGLFKTVGIKASIIIADGAGGFKFGNVASASADNQAFVPQAALDPSGNLLIQGASYYVLTGTGALRHIESGHVNAFAGGGTSVSFTRTFSSTPRVVCGAEDATADTSQNGGAGAPLNYDTGPMFGTVNTVGFSINMSQGGTRNAYWIAEG